jgi:uncharacterized protein
MKQILILVAGLIVVIAFVAIVQFAVSTRQSKTLSVGDKATVTIEIADTPEKQQRGLSYRESLEESAGMLFSFNAPTRPAFWMFEMKFPLDMIWIRDNSIVFIHENVPAPTSGTPDSELPVYQPPVDIDSILEVNAGWVKKNGIVVGDSVKMNSL